MTTPKPIPAMRELRDAILGLLWIPLNYRHDVLRTFDLYVTPERVLEAPAAPHGDTEPETDCKPFRTIAPASTPGLSAEREAEARAYNGTRHRVSYGIIQDLLRELDRLRAQLAEQETAFEAANTYLSRAASHPAPGGSHE